MATEQQQQKEQQLDQQQAEAAAKREQLEREREKLPPYLPSIRGSRSVEEFKVWKEIYETNFFYDLYYLLSFLDMLAVLPDSL